MKTMKALLILLVSAAFATPVNGGEAFNNTHLYKCKDVAFQISQALRTARSYIQFQIDNNIPAGVVATLQRQYKKAEENGEYIVDWCNRNIESCKNNAVAVAFHTPGTATEKFGMGSSTYQCTYGLVVTREDRRALQLALKDAGFDPGPADGQFGPKTQAAIKAWQRSVRQTATGKLNANQIRRLLPGKFWPSSKKTKPVQQAKATARMKGGESGSSETVQALQKILKFEGFDPGSADGVYGPGTRAAVKAWQQSIGQAATGEITDNQMRLLLPENLWPSSKQTKPVQQAKLPEASGKWGLKFVGDTRSIICTKLGDSSAKYTWSGQCGGGIIPIGKGVVKGVVGDTEGFEGSGGFVVGKRNGHWVLRYADGEVEEGLYVDNEKNGNWVIRLADGGVEEGPYVDGKRDGLWVYRAPDGGENETCLREDKEIDLWNCKKDDLWGSIAFSKNPDGGNAWSIVWNSRGRDSARQQSVNVCEREGGTNCGEVGWFRNACGALAIDSASNGYGTGWGESTNDAESKALSNCRLGDNDNCQIEVSRCADGEFEIAGMGEAPETTVATATAGGLSPKCGGGPNQPIEKNVGESLTISPDVMLT